MSNHTPGPWSVRDYKNAGGGIWVDCNAFANKGKGRCLGGTVCDVLDSGETQAANARLIASAPDLLATLQAVANSDMAMREEDEGHTSAIMVAVRAAISKATA